MKFLTLRRKTLSSFGENRFVFNTPPEGDPQGSSSSDPEPTPPEGDPQGDDPETTPKPSNSAEARIQQLVSERNEALERAKELEEAQNALELKKKEEAGEFKNLYEETKSTLAEKDAIIAELNKKTQDFEESLQKNIESQLQKIPESEQDFVKTLLEGKSIPEKQTLLPSILEKFSKPANFGGEPKGGAGNPDAKARFSELNAKDKLTIQEEAEFSRLASELSNKS